MSTQKYPQTKSVSSSTSGPSRANKRQHYSHAILDAKKARKRKEAEARQDKYDRLTTAQKLAQLPTASATRQRNRLIAQLARESASPSKAAPLTDAQRGAKLVKRAQDAVAALPVR